MPREIPYVGSDQNLIHVQRNSGSKLPKGKVLADLSQISCDASPQAGRATSPPACGRFYVRVGSELAEPHALLEDPGQTGLPSLDGEPFWAAATYHEGLREAGLGRFNAVMRSSRGWCMRALATRENWRLQVRWGKGLRTVFLKKHHVRCRWSRLRAWLGLPAGRSAARDEAENTGKLERAGIPCMELAAYGERLGEDGVLESFLITPELEGFTQLDDFLRARFPVLVSEGTEHRDCDLQRLIDQVADIARWFHEAGFNHRDLYCCHFFVSEAGRGEFEIRLIDLQRVQHRSRRRRRWIVKDLAQLAYSAPRDRVKCTQKMAFMHRYLGVRKLLPEHKRLVREILAKQQSMERKQGLIA